MIRSELNNYILISGTGRNIGKTTLACKIITSLSSNYEVVGIKVSPHFHEPLNNAVLIMNEENVRIFQEFDIRSSKDTSRMMLARAKDVFYVECNDAGLLNAIEVLNGIIKFETPVVCESGALAFYFNPGYHILVEGDHPDISKSSYKRNLGLANDIIKSKCVFNDDDIMVSFENGTWNFSL